MNDILEVKLLTLVTNHVFEQFNLPDIDDECHYKFKTALRYALDTYLYHGINYSLSFSETEDYLKCSYRLFTVKDQKQTKFEIKLPITRTPDELYRFRSNKKTWEIPYPSGHTLMYP